MRVGRGMGALVAAGLLAGGLALVAVVPPAEAVYASTGERVLAAPSRRFSYATPRERRRPLGLDDHHDVAGADGVAGGDLHLGDGP